MLNLNNTLDGYLKNVEVIGNTVQDTDNLADIRSVGDKVDGQELYKIPVVSCGKNILSEIWRDGSNGEVDVYCGFKLQLDVNKSYTVSIKYKRTISSTEDVLGAISPLVNPNSVSSNLPNKRFQTVFSKGVRLDKVTFLSNCMQDDGTCYLTIYPGSHATNFELYNSFVEGLIECIQIEEGTVATEHEPYQEDKLEILSPVQLEKVGDVADRIIYKDGVWGVEKNVDAEVQNNILVNTKTNSEFIPLPHDQQVKLRTFAGQTNISFLTEIEGQIKAQVPKSLGATVNTHTEQISNLNKELDRVKKLEESTVSTIETERSFTTVDATSNGYFEGVKLEGKTLVNLYPNSYNWTTASNTIAYNNNISLDNLNIKPNTLYTAYLYNTPTNFNGFLFHRIQQNSSRIHGNIGTFTTNDLSDNSSYLHIYMNSDGVFTTDNTQNIRVVLLEGDHTNNPPEYFEGLMSVGQDVDEVSVESVKGDGNLFKGHNEPINCIEGETYYFNHSYTNNPPCWARFYDVNNNIVLEKNIWIGKVVIPSNCKYLKINTSNVLVDDIAFFKGDSPKSYTPHQSDKKPLLYYNPTTETWEKPILRQWDSIEKHSDGKYYYHKRSGEVVLNGSENWLKTSTQPTSGVHSRFIISNFPNDVVQSLTSVICDKYNNQKLFNESSVGIYLDKNINITVDGVVELEVFKQDLQANNVTVVYQLAQEEVYECTNIDLMTYSGETNYIINSGTISPKSLLKVHNNISNVVKILQEKVSLLENTFIAGLKSVLAGDMYSLATILYPEDFEQNDNIENDIMVIPE